MRSKHPPLIDEFAVCLFLCDSGLDFFVLVIRFQQVEVEVRRRDPVQVVCVSGVEGLSGRKQQLVAAVRNVMHQWHRLDREIAVAVSVVEVVQVDVRRLDASFHQRPHHPSAAAEAERRSVRCEGVERAFSEVISVPMCQQNKPESFCNWLHGLVRNAAVDENLPVDHNSVAGRAGCKDFIRNTHYSELRSICSGSPAFS